MLTGLDSDRAGKRLLVNAKLGDLISFAKSIHVFRHAFQKVALAEIAIPGHKRGKGRKRAVREFEPDAFEVEQESTVESVGLPPSERQQTGVQAAAVVPLPAEGKRPRQEQVLRLVDDFAGDDINRIANEAAAIG